KPSSKTADEIARTIEDDEKSDEQRNELAEEKNNFGEARGGRENGPCALLDCEGKIERLTVALEMQRHRLAGNEIHAQRQPIDHVTQALAVYCNEVIADGDFRFFRSAAAINFVDHHMAIGGILHTEAGAPKSEQRVVGECDVAEDTGDGAKNDPRTWARG